jgi:murein DD-endopeptidase MepM/ murein hydrolase activator NlpD
MQRRIRPLLAAAVATSALASVVVAAPAVASAQQSGTSAAPLARPGFTMPFRCNQTWVGSNWNGHSPGHSIDWNHYDAAGNPDDRGRAVLASAAGRVVSSHYSTTTGYGNTIVIDHGNGWRTRYAHLKDRGAGVGAQVRKGQQIGTVGATSAKYEITPHLHYEQILNGGVVVAVVQGVSWPDFTKRSQTSKTNC